MANPQKGLGGGAVGASDVYLKITGAKRGLIKGEGIDEQHKDEIEVLSWSWGMQAKVQLATGQASGRATISELVIVKKVDAASTALMSALRTNEPIKTAVLTLRKAGKGQHEYLKVTIEDGRVVSLNIETDPASPAAEVLERVSFSFNKIEVEYTPQGADGQPRGSSTFTDQWTAGS